MYDAPANHFVANFLGDNNMLACTLAKGLPAGAASGTGGVRTADGHTLQSRICSTRTLEANCAVKLCVRPEFLQVASDSAALATANCLKGTLLDLIHQGDHWRLVARLEGAQSDNSTEAPQWFAKISPGALPAGLVVGQSLCLGFRPEDAWVF